MYGYVYDAEGDRVAKGTLTSFSCNLSSNGFSPTAQYIVGLGGEQLTELDGSNNWIHTNIFAGGALLATYANGDTDFALTDWQGTKRAVILADGALNTCWSSLAYGNNLAPCPQAGGSDPSDLHYTGKERDSESGNDYFGARYYNSAVGRWMSPDVMQASTKHLAYPQRWNMYAYVRNNPLSLFDPNGDDDIYVFRPEVTSESAAWKAIETDGARHGNPVHMLLGRNATVDAYKKALATPNAHVIFAGHAVEDGSHHSGSVHLANGDIGTLTSVESAKNGVDAQPVAGVKATSVGAFGCNTSDLAPQYSGTSYTGVNSGSDAGTSLEALGNAARAYAGTLAKGGGISDANTAAEQQIQASPYKEDHNGDMVCSAGPSTGTCSAVTGGNATQLRGGNQ